MKKISLLLAIILTLAIILSGCGSNGGSANMKAEIDMATPGAPMEAPDMNPSVYYGGGIKDGSYTESSSDIYNNESNKIIRRANLTIQSTDFDAAVEALNRLTQENGGYYETAEVESGSYHNQYANRSAYYVVRIPRENFVAFRDGTGGIGHVYNISESTQDVGEAYYDTEARLKTLETKRDRLLALLEKAEKMEDIITLNDALADVQYQIDMHTSTLRKYDSLIGFSTFNIRLHEVQEIIEEPGVKESFGSKFLSSLKRGFADFGEGLQNFAIWFARNLMGIIIFAVVVVVVVIVVRLTVRRRRAKRNSAE